MLRIGFDASGLAASKRATGLQRYLGSLLEFLVPRLEPDDLALYMYFAHQPPNAATAEGTPLSTVLPGPRIHWRTAPMARGWQRMGMGLAMQLDRLNVFHFPGPLMSGYCPVPSVVTFHDLAALSIEADQTAKERRYLPDALDAGRRATSIIAVSQSTGDEVIRFLHRPDVVVIPEGIDLRKFARSSAETVAAVRSQYGIERYILCVGTLQTRKNHLGLIRAFEQIQDRVPHSLVLVGGDGSGAEEVKAYLAAHPNPRIICTGYADDATLPALYTGAEAFALPSLWEGFGLPLVEAMACGVPILTSNVSSLAEIAGDAAVLVDPRNTDEIAQGLVNILTDDTLRDRLIAAGSQRSQALSWEQTAAQTIKVYRTTVQR